MDITRYDGTRYVTEEEIDQEFTGQLVLVSLANVEDTFDGGYLVAVAANNQQGYNGLSDLAFDEFNTVAKIYFGCLERGGNLHVELLG